MTVVVKNPIFLCMAFAYFVTRSCFSLILELYLNYTVDNVHAKRVFVSYTLFSVLSQMFVFYSYTAYSTLSPENLPVCGYSQRFSI